MNKPKIVGVLVARQTSSRLPGKALVDVAGVPMIGHLLRRLAATRGIDAAVVATSVNPEDNAIAEYAEREGFGCFRGSPDDVLDRVYSAAKYFGADAIIEVGGDCPFVGPRLLEEGIKIFRETGADLVSNALVAPFTYPVGYDCILVRTEALAKAHARAKLSSERFQPFQYMVSHLGEFNVKSFYSPENLNHWRWTMDYPEDLAFVRAVYDQLFAGKPLFEMPEIIELLRANPGLIGINSMHAEAVTLKTIWHTGSFVAETHADLKKELQNAWLAEQAKDFIRAREAYEIAGRLVKELGERAAAFAEKKGH